MKRTASLLLALVMVLSVFSALAVPGLAAGYKVPKSISMSQTGGKFSESFADGTLTYKAGGTGIDHGVDYPFLELSNAGTQNQNIARVMFDPEVRFAMSTVCRTGKVKKISIHNYVDHYNSSTDTYTISASNGRVNQISRSTKRYYKGGMDSQQPSTSVFTFTYDDMTGNLVKINWHAGKEAERTVFEYQNGQLVSSTWTCGSGKDVVTRFTLDSEGRVTKYGRIKVEYNSKGLVSKIDTWTFSYNDTGTMKSAVDHDVNNKAAASFSYTYTTICRKIS